MLKIIRQPTQHGAWVALALTAAALQGCAEKPAPPVSHARLFASDFQGAAKQCTAAKPTLAPGKEAQVAMEVGNDGGWCAISVQQDGKPYATGLLTDAPAHGSVYIHPVGEETRIDYTPDRGFAGNDSFVVTLLPDKPVIRVAVKVTR